MLFYTPQFIFLFLPVTLLVYFGIGRISWRAAFAWLAIASLFFYGVWNPRYLPLILGSICVNYFGGFLLGGYVQSASRRIADSLFALLILANLGTLAYFKYLVFAVGQMDKIFPVQWNVGEIVLPIGISFYTFTQIAYLADVRYRRVRERGFLSYLLFVTYFPHLIAGPIIHHSEMMPQFANSENLKLRYDNLARGITFFAFGLFKKIVFADGCAPIANIAFRTDAAGVSSIDAWLGVTAYTLQIYYDFSGYCDMAIGISLLFNISLPVNFSSPYQARSIIDFWRRWHITLSRFLRDYLYFALGGNRRGVKRRYVNLGITMLLGGLWHGANWTYLVWGGLHGTYLVINHGWRHLTKPSQWPNRWKWLFDQLAGWITILAVMVAWIFFRADSISNALSLLFAMVGHSSVSIGQSQLMTAKNLLFLGLTATWVLFAPNTNQILRYRFGIEDSSTVPEVRLVWNPNIIFAVWAAIVLFASALFGITGRDKLEFLYFQF